jgi:hypothetical protein
MNAKPSIQKAVNILFARIGVAKNSYEKTYLKSTCEQQLKTYKSGAAMNSVRNGCSWEEQRWTDL